MYSLEYLHMLVCCQTLLQPDLVWTTLPRAGFHLLLEESENFRMPVADVADEADVGKSATKGLFQFLLASPVEDKVPESRSWG